LAPRPAPYDRRARRLNRAGGGRFPCPEQEREIVTRAAARDESASATLVATFTPSIGGVARMYRHVAGVDRTELMQAGVEGLLRAARRYDAGAGTPFWAYASWWVRQAMQQQVAEMSGPIVLSDRALRQLARVRDTRREFTQAHQHEPSVSELADETELTRTRIERLLASERTPRSLDVRVRDDDASTETFKDLLEDPDAQDESERVLEGMETAEFADRAEMLTGRDRAIVHGHYGLGCVPETLRELAERLGLSVERVRQLEERALGRLRDAAAAPPTG
jgi:RNA polymerase primary sigma factor